MGVTTIKSDTFATNIAYLSESNPRLGLQLQLESMRKKSAPGALFAPRKKSVAAIDVLYLFGWEGGKSAPMLLQWLRDQPHRMLILLARDLARLAAALENPCWTSLLSDQRVTCCLPDEALHATIWDALHRQSRFVNLAVAKTDWAREGERCRQLILEFEWEAESALAATRDFGVRAFENLCCNLLQVTELIEAKSLWNQFARMPAVICGAGPSLDEEINVLKTLGGRALIIAAGSAIHCLERQGIEPHFGVALDPDLPPERMRRQQSFGVPFFYQQQLSQELFSLLQGETVAAFGSAASGLQREFLTRLGLAAAPFEAGWNAVTFASHIAYCLGCAPLVFVGIDGCVSDGRTYAEKAAYPDEQVRWQRVDAIACVDRENRPAWSRPDFLLGKKWLESFAQNHPECQLINASGKGLAFAGLFNRPLSELAETFFALESDVKGKVQCALAIAERKKVEKKQVIAQIKCVSQSALRCTACCAEILNGYRKQQASARACALVASIELEEEFFWQTVLAPLWEIWRHVIQRKETVQNMTNIAAETAIQQALFAQRVCSDYERAFTRLLKEDKL
ncbi:MAG: 6-hydroxymethylpterin diphosphokinase MptE-like protein [Chlamydiota bacterium]